jgi:predicted enzyme related to lactoylglutathione lyase
MTSVTLSVADMDATERFYGDFLGIDLGELHTHEGGEVQHQDAGWGSFDDDTWFLLEIVAADGDRRTTGVQLGLRVKNLDELVARAESMGVPVVQATTEMPWGRNAKFRDPDGNLVSLTES